MLDRYWHGVVERLSPEAPVPVLRRQFEILRLGGAGNVAKNVSTLDCDTLLGSVCGTDDAGYVLDSLLADAGIRSLIERRADIVTTQKIRPIAGRYQLARIDIEAPLPDLMAVQRMTAFAASATADLCILSDYGHGALTYAQQLIAAHVRTIVDPKGTDWGRYRGAWLIKPNEAELRAMVGPWKNDGAMYTMADNLRVDLGVEHMLVTLGSRGMVLINDDMQRHFRSSAVEVFDVTGAGDTVIATLGAALVNGYNLIDSIVLASKAAGIVVSRIGTSSVTWKELL